MSVYRARPDGALQLEVPSPVPPGGPAGAHRADTLDYPSSTTHGTPPGSASCTGQASQDDATGPHMTGGYTGPMVGTWWPWWGRGGTPWGYHRVGPGYRAPCTHAHDDVTMHVR